jgi:hypothetical protein
MLILQCVESTYLQVDALNRHSIYGDVMGSFVETFPHETILSKKVRVPVYIIYNNSIPRIHFFTFIPGNISR